MEIRHNPPLHLTYCLNMHPGESWSENLAAIRNHTLNVKSRICADRPFGLGLRLGNQAAEQLAGGQRLAEFKEFLEAGQLYAFTINGFPYGPFHGQPVKENVYLPDWRMVERADYSMRLGDILAELLPEGVAGSISTVPVGYSKNIGSSKDFESVAENLAASVAALARLHDKSGADICLALEPEPDCVVEKTGDMVRFYDEKLLPLALPLLAKTMGCGRAEAEKLMRRHLGICLDTCHMAVQFEDPLDSLRQLETNGIRVGKIQVSSALRAELTPAAIAALAELDDSVYLHQVRVRDGQGQIHAYPDIDPANLQKIDSRAGGEIRAHMHVPLYFEHSGPLHSTIETLPDQFWAAATAATSHLEVETYTMEILPSRMRESSIEESIARELEWVRARV